MPDRPTEWHPQDWIIVIQALTAWAGPPAEATGRHTRAWELIEDIANEQGLPPAELVRQSRDR